MCDICWVEQGRPTKECLPPNSVEIVSAIRDLYEMPRCEAGGPLHVVLDDWNLEDEFLIPWVGPKGLDGAVIDRVFSSEVISKAQTICDLMRPLSEAERAAVLGQYWGYFA